MSLDSEQRELNEKELRVLDDVRAILDVVIGEDYMAEMEVGPETAFYADLDIESIELVALGEALQEKYGDLVDFAAWIGTMELEEIIAVTVGDLVVHIASVLP